MIGCPIAVDSARVYYTSSENMYYTSQPLIMMAALDGSAPTVLAPNSGATALAVDDQFVYWVDPQGMNNLGYPLSGGTVEKIAKPK
jgi:hypothetical protein